MAEMGDEIRKLRVESEFPKRRSGLLRQATARAERCALIEAEKVSNPGALVCSILGVARSTSCEWRRHVTTLTATTARRSELAIKVGAVFAESPETHCCRRITQVLNERGHACSVRLVADVACGTELRTSRPRAYRVPTVRSQGDEEFGITGGIR